LTWDIYVPCQGLTPFINSGAKIHQDTSFHKAIFQTNIEGYTAVIPQSDFYHRASTAWQTLKSAMNTTNNRTLELFFFEHEMDAKIEYENWPAATLFRVYKLSSSYGASIVRPLICFIISMITFASFYSVLPLGINLFFDGINLSIANSMPFTNSSKLVVSEILGRFAEGSLARTIVQILGSIQNVISLIFISLVVLGLKNKLSIK
jgi:hypothetical protein